MRKQLLGELVIIVTGTLFFFALSATFGIPGDEERAPTSVAAEDAGTGMGGPSSSEPRGPLGGGWER